MQIIDCIINEICYKYERIMDMRLKITLKVCANDVFLYEGYQEHILLYFQGLFNNSHLSITDFLSPRKIKTDKGIWLIDKANIIICSPFLGSFLKQILYLPGKHLEIQGNMLVIDNVRLYRQETLYKGILLSGVFSHKDGVFLEYEKSPEMFSEYLRLNLIEVYKTVNKKEPDDKRFFIGLNGGCRKQYILGIPMYEGIYEIFGSPELCSIFNECFVTGKIGTKSQQARND